MKTFEDYERRQVVLTAHDEQHIVTGHYEISVLGSDRVIRETLASPDVVVNVNQSLQYLRVYRDTPFGDKYVRLVVVESEGVWYLRTAFITARIAKGRVIWERGM